ncbi:MAG: type II secretion system protein [Planctomycetota bacterium]|jgi:prepilin-type processing-associated H-X9-DG protein/prepilin-type N-terminal cleavage/methylation domain-containing protein
MKSFKYSEFTLIELMVTIAIILILCGILVPALETSHKSAVTTGCIQNLKQIGIISAAYISDSNNYVYPALPESPVGHWINWMYFHGAEGTAALFQCPEVGKEDDFNPYGGNGDYSGIKDASYIMNIIGTSSVTQNEAWGDPVVPYAGQYTGKDKYGWTTGDSSDPLKITEAINPAGTILITDIAAPLTNSSTGKGIYRFIETDHGIFDSNNNGTSNAGERKVGFQHNNRFNALYGDGHCKTIEKSKPDEWVAIVKD